jgi:hypothetical protein
MPEPPVRVLLVAGVAHCGSTLVGSLLGQADGAFFAGELAHTARALERDLDCGCGEPLRTCAVWRGIFAEAFGAGGVADGPERLRLEHRDERARAAFRHALRDRGFLPRSPELEQTLARFVATLRAIRAVTGSEVVVDSTKSPAYGRFLASSPDVDLRVLHLVRDPRATAWSWRKAQDSTLRPAALGIVWDVWNPTIEALWARDAERYLRVRYEDFARQPRETSARVLAFAGLAPDAVPFTDSAVDLAPTHSTTGNPGRFRTGRVEIHPDRAWEQVGRFRGLRAVSAVTWPVRRRYGY